jgi:hypothetical protein
MSGANFRDFFDDSREAIDQIPELDNLDQGFRVGNEHSLQNELIEPLRRLARGQIRIQTPNE